MCDNVCRKSSLPLLEPERRPLNMKLLNLILKYETKVSNLLRSKVAAVLM